MSTKRVVKTLLLVLFISSIIAIGYFYRDHIYPQQLKRWLDQLGMWAPVIFIGIYFLGTVALLPGAILTLSGGIIFGPIYGVIYNMIGATLGASTAFIIARYFASDWVTQLTGKKMRVLINGINTEGWRFVALTRLAPIVPFNVLNYALGVTKIPFSHYFTATVICILPGCAAYTYLGHLGVEAAAAKEGLIQKALIALFLLAIAAYSKRLLNLIRNKP